MADECRPVEIDGQVVRVRGEREMDDTDRAMLAEVIAAAKRELIRRDHQEERPMSSDESLAAFAALADEWDQRADRANVEMAAGAIHGCAAELRQTLRDHQEER